MITLERFLRRKGKSLLKYIRKFVHKVQKKKLVLLQLIKPQDQKAFYDQTSEIALETFFFSSQKLVFSNEASPKVSIILILYNKAHLTLGCLRSILENTKLPYEVILVDNASKDRTNDLLNRIEGAKIIRNSENVGFLKACNQAAKIAVGENLLFLNNDTVVLSGSLECAIKTLESSSKTGAVGAKIINLNGKLQEAGSFIWRDGSCQGYGRGADPFQGEFQFQRDVDYCSGAFLLTPRTLFEKFNGFDEAFAPAYYEETDYCTRLRENDYRIIYEPRAAILHYEFGSASGSNEPIQLMLEHQKIFVQKHNSELAKHFEKSDDKILAARHSKLQKRVLFIEDSVPHPRLGAGFPRTHRILKSLHEFGLFITLYPTQQTQDDWHSVYETLPADVEVILGWGEYRFREFLEMRAGYYDFIWISRPHNMEALQSILSQNPDLIKNTRVIYDAEAVFTNRNRAFSALKSGAESKNSIEDKRFEAKLREEMSLGKSADQIISVSPREKTQFESFGYKNVKVLGHAHQVVRSEKKFHERKHILFVGAIHYHPSPNSDSVIWFAQNVFPLIQSQLGSQVQFLVAGLNTAPEVQALASANVKILGPVKDLSLLFSQCRIFVAPTRFAAGIPYKVHEAVSHGLPCVTSDLLAEQLGWKDGEALMSASISRPELFAEKCVRLYSQEDLWSQIQQGGLKKISEDCSLTEFNHILMSVLGLDQRNL